MKRTTMEKVINGLMVFQLILAVVLCTVIILEQYKIFKEEKQSTTVEYSLVDHEVIDVPVIVPLDYYISEEPNESELIEEAVIDALSEEALGYDFDYVARVIEHEAGGDGEDMILAVCQCIQNSCIKSNGTMSPEDVVRERQYTSPLDYYSDLTKECMIKVFLEGYTYEPVKNANMFYSTEYCDYSYWHEIQEFITQMNYVRFFYEA